MRQLPHWPACRPPTLTLTLTRTRTRTRTRALTLTLTPNPNPNPNPTPTPNPNQDGLPTSLPSDHSTGTRRYSRTCAVPTPTGTARADRITSGRSLTTRAPATHQRRYAVRRCWCTGVARSATRTAPPSTTYGASSRGRRTCMAGSAATTRARTWCQGRSRGDLGQI